MKVSLLKISKNRRFAAMGMHRTISCHSAVEPCSPVAGSQPIRPQPPGRAKERASFHLRAAEVGECGARALALPPLPDREDSYLRPPHPREPLEWCQDLESRPVRAIAAAILSALPPDSSLLERVPRPAWGG